LGCGRGRRRPGRAGKLAGVTLQVVDVVSGNVVQTFEGKSARKAGVAKSEGPGRSNMVEFDYDVCPTDKYIQARYNAIFAARGDARALRALNTFKRNQSQSRTCGRYLDWLVSLAEADEEKYGGSMDHLLAAD
jgi:hypothetical protein